MAERNFLRLDRIGASKKKRNSHAVREKLLGTPWLGAMEREVIEHQRVAWI